MASTTTRGRYTQAEECLLKILSAKPKTTLEIVPLYFSNRKRQVSEAGQNSTSTMLNKLMRKVDSSREDFRIRKTRHGINHIKWWKERRTA